MPADGREDAEDDQDPCSQLESRGPANNVDQRSHQKSANGESGEKSELHS